MSRPLTAVLRVASRPALAALVLVTFPALAAAQLPAPGSTYHLLFATSNNYRTTSTSSIPPPTLRFGNIAGADYQVTSAAADGLLPGTLAWDGISPIYRAILSITGDNARDRLGVSGPVYNLHGSKLADGHADLFDGDLAAPVAYDEYGALITEDSDVWTGCTLGGVAAGSSCGDWDDTSNAVNGRTGTVVDAGAWLSIGSNKPCNQGARLYALSPALTAPLWGDYNGDGAVDAADYVMVAQGGRRQPPKQRGPQLPRRQPQPTGRRHRLRRVANLLRPDAPRGADNCRPRTAGSRAPALGPRRRRSGRRQAMECLKN